MKDKENRPTNELEIWTEKLTLEQAREIYENRAKTDFPPEEIKPFSLIEKMWGQGCYHAYGFYERIPEDEGGQTEKAEATAASDQTKKHGQMDREEVSKRRGTLCAYAFLLGNNKEHVLLLDYFAVCKQKRGMGYGSRALPLLQEKCACWGRMVIEVEDDELASIDDETRMTRKRRISFYTNVGCLMTATRSRVWGVDYRIMILPLSDKNAGEGIAEKVTALYDGMYNSETMKKHFAITAE